MIIIRQANLADVGSLVMLWKDFMNDHDQVVLRRNQKKSILKPLTARKKNATSIMKRFFQKTIRSRNGMVLIAELGEQPVGYSLILISKSPPVYQIDKIGYISDLFVRKEYRKKRISSIFKNEAIKWFKKKGLKYASVAASPENKAACYIYRKWGFFDYSLEMRKRIS